MPAHDRLQAKAAKTYRNQEYFVATRPIQMSASDAVALYKKLPPDQRQAFHDQAKAHNDRVSKDLE